MKGGGEDHHLVERPRIAEVRYPRLAQARRDSAAPAAADAYGCIQT